MNDVLFIKKESKYRKVPVQNILYLNAAGSYLNIITINEEFSLAQNLSQFIRKNEIPSLVRVHRSYLVNVQHIDSFDQTYVYIGTHQIPIGDSYRQEFMEGIRHL